MKILLNGVTADISPTYAGNYIVPPARPAVGSAGVYIHDGSELITAVWSAGFGGGTVSFEGSPDGGTTWLVLSQFITGSGANFTTSVLSLLAPVAQGYLIRARLSGSTTPSAVYATVGT